MRNAIVTADLDTILGCGLAFEKYRGKTVLISGASGFLPAYMVETLLYGNERLRGPKTRVIALVRNRAKAETRFRHYLECPELELLVQDVCQPVITDGPIDTIVHAASPASPKDYARDPVGTLSANVFGTRNLLELAQHKQSQVFLFFSSSEVYGQLTSRQSACSETTLGQLDLMQLRSCYAESKRMGEAMCAAWFHQYGLPVRIVRPFHTYGPGMALDDGRVFCDFVADIVERRDIVIKSEGTAVRAYCYLSDAVAGFFTVLLKGTNGQAYNIGNPQAAVSVYELAETLTALFPERSRRIRRSKQAQNCEHPTSGLSRVVPDIRKIEELGWSPRYHLESGFHRTIAGFLLDRGEMKPAEVQDFLSLQPV